MDISAITLQNFKGVSNSSRIELKPITLLFGPNSAGKSTLLQALVYAHEILNHNNLDPDRTALGGEVMDLGGFERIIHSHDRNKKVVIGIEMDVSNTDLPGVPGGNINSNHFEELLEQEDSKLPSPDIFLSKIDRVECLMTIAWSKVLKSPIVERLDYVVNGKLLVRIESNADKANTVIKYLDVKHAIFLGYEDDDWFLDFMDDVIDDRHATTFYEANIPISGCDGALPKIGKALSIQSINSSSSNRAELPLETDVFISLFFNRLLSGSLLLLRERLDNLIYIGPLREVPPRDALYRRTKSPSRWSRGMAGWDILHSADDSFIDEVNHWLYGDNQLNSGYSIYRHNYKEVSVDGFGDIDSFEKLPDKSRITLKEHRNDIEVYPQDVGVGISQVIPVIVAALSLRSSIIAVEQPELHIHPALQVALGDLFASKVHENESMYLLETHSEHLMLRFLRRIREKHEGDLPEYAPEISPDDISVVYVRNTDEGVKFSQLSIREDGEFNEQWPNGFFEERAGELF